MSSDAVHHAVAFLETYRDAFERYDAEAIVSHFNLPSHIVSDGPEIALITYATAEECAAGIRKILELHRRIGVSSGQVLEFAVTGLAANMVSFMLRYQFRDRHGSELYDFQGVYSIVRQPAGWRIAAITHNQVPRLMACVETSSRGP